MKTAHITYLSLGSNQGNRLENIQKALILIDEHIGDILQIASVYETASWGFESENFYNTCIKVSTFYPANKVLSILLSIENKLGRIRTDTKNYIDRSIDLDILLFDQEIIISKTLTIPHPKMLERKFVLVPLAEIADYVLHPIAKKEIKSCLKQCADMGAISKTTRQLIKPISILEKYNYIAIEGNIGSGKTSLTTKMASHYNAKVVLERFAENPFLPKFYEDKERYAFPLEMSFLADRYQQLMDDLAQFDLFKNCIISDYYIFKSLIFAQVTLAKDEYALYRRMFDVLYKEITKPDVYVYLYQNTERLLENIRKRGRDYEQNIAPTYLEKIHEGYLNFIKTQPNLNTLIIDISELDFVNNEEDYLKILQQIKLF